MRAFFAGAGTATVLLFAIQQHIKSNYNQVQNSLDSAKMALSVRMNGQEVEQPITRPLTGLWNSSIGKIAKALTHIQ